VRPCAKELFILLQENQSSSLQAIRKKFSLAKFGEVAKIRLEQNTAPNTNLNS